MLGTIVRKVEDRGFGFIEGDDGEEYFFHRSVVSPPGFDRLKVNTVVEFETQQSPKGLRASLVSPVLQDT